jgi:predicted DNA-binding protein with PD1-like motif
MKYSEAQQGRVFILRLEDGENLQECIEQVATENNIRHAFIQVLGGADKGSKIIAGPEHGRAENIVPMTEELNEMHEALGNGTLIPDEKGVPVLHMHMAFGRNNKTLCGEIRPGIIVWHVMEVIIVELLNSSAVRKLDAGTGFKLLQP